MIWKSVGDKYLYGIAINNFDQEDKPHRLTLDVGDAVIITRETNNWYYGYKKPNKNNLGIFPKSYIHICESVIRKNDYIIKRSDIVEEITSVLREWGVLFKKLYFTKHPRLMDIRAKMRELIAYRSLILSGNLPVDEMRKYKLLATTVIDTGNSILGLDMVVRDETGSVLNVNKTCTTELYEYHLSAVERIREATNLQNKSRKTENINKYSHNLLLTIHAFVCKFQEDCDLLFTLYCPGVQIPITENYVVKWSRQGIARDIDNFNDNRVLFTDLSSNDLNMSKIHLVCFAVRIGSMEVKEQESKRNSVTSITSSSSKKLSQMSLNSSGSYNFTEQMRRPFGVAAIDLTPVLKKPEDFKNNHDLPFILCEKENLDSALKRLINNKDCGKIDSKLAVSVEVLHGDIKQIKEEYPHLVRGNLPIARKMGFPEVIFPGDVRNDLYLTLVGAEFTKHAKGGDKNIEVTITVCDEKGTIVPDVISLGVGISPLNEYKSIVYYHEDKPKWWETFKIHIPIEEFKKCHLKFTFKHRSSNEQKDRAEKPFGLSYVKLMQVNGTTLQRGCHRLALYKIDYKKYDKEDVASYLELPSMFNEAISCPQKPSTAGLSFLTKDLFQIETNLCSTKLTEDVKLLGVLNWSSQKEKLEESLTNLHSVPEGEVVKFLQDILDALFNILVENDDPDRYDPLVFSCLIRLIEIVHDLKYEHFQSVLDLYINESFCATLAYGKLLNVLKKQISSAIKLDGVSKANDLTLDATGKYPCERLFKTIKQLHYIMKFVIRSRLLFADLNDNRGEEEFKRDIEDLLSSFVKMIGCRNELLLKVEGALLKYLHIVASDLMVVYDPVNLSHSIVDIITTFPPGRLTQWKMLSIRDFIDSKLFLLPECRGVLLPVFCKQIKDRLESKEEICECVNIMNNMLKLLNRNDIGPVENDVRDIMLVLLRTVIQTSIAMDRENPLVGNLVAIMLGILHSMHTIHYDIYVKHFNTRFDLQDFLTEILLVFKDLVSKPVFPADWMDMIMQQNTVILESLRQLASVIIKYFFSPFDKQVWSNFFQCSIAFLIQSPLQLDTFSENKRLTILSRYKDIRRATAMEIQMMWFQLGEHKRQFVPQLVGPILEMSMIPEVELRRTTIPIFFDMMQCEYYSSRFMLEGYGDTKRNTAHSKGNFNDFETEMIEKLDILVEGGKGDYEFKELFYEIMMNSCSAHKTLCTDGTRFVLIVKNLLERLLEYRCIMINDESKENRMACTVSLLQFYSDVNRKEMYIRYVYKLFDLHMEFDNYTEAAYTLKLHSNLLSWDDIELPPLLKSYRHPNCRTNRQLKQALYYDIIKYFDKGKMWECAIELCKELAEQYEKEIFDYLSLSEIHRKMAEFFEKILKEMRHECEYFRVGFYGLKFPEFLQNKIFIYRGKEYERLSDFCTRILTQHPSAELMQTLTTPGPEITHSDGKYIQINNVEPIMDEKYERFLNESGSNGNGNQRFIAKEIIKYYRTNNVQKFRFSRPDTKDGDTSSSNGGGGVENLWLERTIMTTSLPLPGILRWFPVVSSEKYRISPIEHAIETMETTNNVVKDLIIAHKSDENLTLNPLSMKINGIVDPAVMGGFSKYEKAFLTPEYLDKHPEDEHLVVRLKDLIASQIPLLEIALSVHRTKAPASLIPFHERLEKCFLEMQADVESKYGKKSCDLKFDRDTLVIMRRSVIGTQMSVDNNNRLSETSIGSSDSGLAKSTPGNRSQANSIKSTFAGFNFNTGNLTRSSLSNSPGIKKSKDKPHGKRRSFKKLDRDTLSLPVSNSQWYTTTPLSTITPTPPEVSSASNSCSSISMTTPVFELTEELTPKRPLRSEVERERRLSRPASIATSTSGSKEFSMVNPNSISGDRSNRNSFGTTTDSTGSEESLIPPPLPAKTRDSSDLGSLIISSELQSQSQQHQMFRERQFYISSITNITNSSYEYVETKNYTINDDKKRPPTPPPKPYKGSKSIPSP